MASIFYTLFKKLLIKNDIAKNNNDNLGNNYPFQHKN